MTLEKLLKEKLPGLDIHLAERMIIQEYKLNSIYADTVSMELDFEEKDKPLLDFIDNISKVLNISTSAVIYAFVEKHITT